MDSTSEGSGDESSASEVCMIAFERHEIFDKAALEAARSEVDSFVSIDIAVITGLAIS